MADTILQTESAPATPPHVITVLDELGGYIMRTSALLRAVINTSGDEREDEAWLVDLAYKQAEEARKQYLEWALPGEKRQH